jgi:hypothetical protein
VRVVGESAALLTWVVIFAPVAWEHYYVYFCPFWGWLFGEVALGGWRRYVAGAVLLAHAIPWPILNRPIVAREPFASVMLIGAGLLLVLSLSRLGLTREPATVPLTPHTPERQGPGERPFAAG